MNTKVENKYGKIRIQKIITGGKGCTKEKGGGKWESEVESKRGRGRGGGGKTKKKRES
jgi:hypothetical protein